jgi:hypothetical protein
VSATRRQLPPHEANWQFTRIIPDPGITLLNLGVTETFLLVMLLPGPIDMELQVVFD